MQTALKRAPEQRYQSAAELADDLERLLDDKPVRAQADSAVYRLRKFVSRNQAGVVAGAAVVLALAAGLGAALWQAQSGAGSRRTRRGCRRSAPRISTRSSCR